MLERNVRSSSGKTWRDLPAIGSSFIFLFIYLFIVLFLFSLLACDWLFIYLFIVLFLFSLFACDCLVSCLFIYWSGSLLPSTIAQERFRTVNDPSCELNNPERRLDGDTAPAQLVWGDSLIGDDFSWDLWASISPTTSSAVLTIMDWWRRQSSVRVTCNLRHDVGSCAWLPRCMMRITFLSCEICSVASIMVAMHEGSQSIENSRNVLASLILCRLRQSSSSQATKQASLEARIVLIKSVGAGDPPI